MPNSTSGSRSRTLSPARKNRSIGASQYDTIPLAFHPSSALEPEDADAFISLLTREPGLGTLLDLCQTAPAKRKDELAAAIIDVFHHAPYVAPDDDVALVNLGPRASDPSVNVVEQSRPRPAARYPTAPSLHGSSSPVEVPAQHTGDEALTLTVRSAPNTPRDVGYGTTPPSSLLSGSVPHVSSAAQHTARRHRARAAGFDHGVLPMLRQVLSAEVKTTVDQSTLFRSNSQVSALLVYCGKMYGSAYVGDTLQPLLAELMDAEARGDTTALMVEVDPNKVAMGEDLPENTARLTSLAQRFVDRIVSSVMVSGQQSDSITPHPGMNGTSAIHANVVSDVTPEIPTSPTPAVASAVSATLTSEDGSAAPVLKRESSSSAVSLFAPSYQYDVLRDDDDLDLQIIDSYLVAALDSFSTLPPRPPVNASAQPSQTSHGGTAAGHDRTESLHGVHPAFAHIASSSSSAMEATIATQDASGTSISAPHAPVEFRQLCGVVADVAEARFPGARYSALSGFVFLRLFCPAIVAPSGAGSDSLRPVLGPKCRRAFTLVRCPR